MKISGLLTFVAAVFFLAACSKQDAAVEEAAVFTVPGPEGSKAIRAAVTMNSSSFSDDDCASILKHTRARLPWYMIPESVEIRDAFPRTTSGKIDRRALSQEATDAHIATEEAS